MASQSTGFQQMTSISSATAPTVPSETDWAWVQAEGANVRFRLDGTSPTASVGLILADNDPPVEMPVWMLNNVEFIQETATAKVNIQYFKN
jgi:hypothetical protein